MRRALVLLTLACGLLGAPAPAPAGEAVGITLRAGGEFTGTITASDDDGFTLRRTAGGEFRLLWKDLDEPSWLAARRTLTDSKDGAALLELAHFAAQHGLRTDAEGLLTAVLRADAGLAESVAELGPRLAELRAGEADALMERAAGYMKEQNWHQALGRYRDVLELDERHALATNGVGEALYELRRLGPCREHIEKAIELDPQCKDARLNLAYLDLLELDFETCLAGLDELLKLPPAEGKVTTPEELTKKALESRGVTQQEAIEKWADQPLFQATQLRPVIAGIVAGPGFEPEYEALTAHYRVRTDISPEYAERMADRLELIYKEYERQYSPSRTGEVKTRGKKLRFPVLVFSDRNAYVKWFTRVLRNPMMARSTGGVYVPLVKHLVFFKNESWQDTQLVAWHEAFHQYLDYFVARAPHWFNEGQGEYFGASVLPEGRKRVEVGQENRWRSGVLQKMLQAGRLPEASELMRRDAQTFMGGKPKDPRYGGKPPNSPVENYAASWALVHFCIEGQRRRYAKNLMRYFRELAGGASHDAAFEKAWGRVNWDKFNDAWRRHSRWLVNRAIAQRRGTAVPPMPR